MNLAGTTVPEDMYSIRIFEIFNETLEFCFYILLLGFILKRYQVENEFGLQLLTILKKELTLASFIFSKSAILESISLCRLLLRSITVFFSSTHSFKESSFLVKLASKFRILEALQQK